MCGYRIPDSQSIYWSILRSVAFLVTVQNEVSGSLLLEVLFYGSNNAFLGDLMKKKAVFCADIVSLGSISAIRVAARSLPHVAGQKIEESAAPYTPDTLQT